MFGLPFRPNKSWWTIFCMFPYNSTASVFSLSWTKAHYVVNDGIASKFKQLWLHDIKKSDILVVSFDESLNQATQSSEIEMDTKYYVFIENEVKVKYIGSSFMGHWTHEDLIELFTNLIEDVELKKKYQVPLDHSNFNVKVFAKNNDKLHHSFVNIGIWNIHIVQDAFRTGSEKANWRLKETLNVTFEIL